MAAMDIHHRDDLAFPRSLPEFQQLFPDDAACAAYLGRARWPSGFSLPALRADRCALSASSAGRVFSGAVPPSRPFGRHRHGTQSYHTPLSIWFWPAYLVASQTPGMSAVQFQGQLRLTRYDASCTNYARGWCGRTRAASVGRPKDH